MIITRLFADGNAAGTRSCGALWRCDTKLQVSMKGPALLAPLRTQWCLWAEMCAVQMVAEVLYVHSYVRENTVEPHKRCEIQHRCKSFLDWKMQCWHCVAPRCSYCDARDARVNSSSRRQASFAPGWGICARVCVCACVSVCVCVRVCVRGRVSWIRLAHAWARWFISCVNLFKRAIWHAVVLLCERRYFRISVLAKTLQEKIICHNICTVHRKCEPPPPPQKYDPAD